MRTTRASKGAGEVSALYIAETSDEVHSWRSSDEAGAIKLPAVEDDPGVVAGVFAREVGGGRIEKRVAPGSYHACWADCDKNQQLDVYDFLCFQELFMRGVDRACDCDTSSGHGACDIFDLICFQEKFELGCP